MIVRPIYNILLLPDVSYYFKKEFFAGFGGESIEAGDDILFIFLRREKEEGITPDDFYPIGLSARAEGFGDEDAVSVRTLNRVDLSDLEITDSRITVSASIRPDTEDMTEEEAKQQFAELRAALLRFVQGYQWGLWARSFILQRKNINDLACALADYLNLTADEKYGILAADSLRGRYSLIIGAISEFIEVAKVSEEAQNAQKGDQEQLYREAAIKKQIDYLQKELDDMHPENVSDIENSKRRSNLPE